MASAKKIRGEIIHICALAVNKTAEIFLMNM